MRCVESTEISALIDGELDRRETESIDRHIIQCDECRYEKERLLALSAMFPDASPLAIPTALDRRVMETYRARFAPESWYARFFATRLAIPLPIAAAALLFIGSAGVGAYQAGRTNAEPVVITRETLVAQPSVAPVESPASGIQSTPTVGAKDAGPRVVTKIVNVCPSDKKRRWTPLVPRQSAALKTPVVTATTTGNGYFTDLQLAGFEPLAELNAQVIKGVKK